MARWITVHRPFDYHWPGRSAVTMFRDPGEYFVKDEVARFALEHDHANAGKADGSETRSRKGKTAKPNARKGAAKGSAAAKTADTGTKPPVGDQDAADADRPAGGPPVDSDAG
jgi:hypothetical protein